MDVFDLREHVVRQYAGFTRSFTTIRAVDLKARVDGLPRFQNRPEIPDPAAVMGADYPTDTFRGLKRNELARYGEYRTERLVLEAWDRMFGRWQEAMVPTGSPGGVQA